jgi:glycosyltransferase involved in cell wall biosynthesis
MEAFNLKYSCQICVGMPVWGVEKYIKRCLLSILDQDFDDMEVLVINDCTPDKSIDIVKGIAASHPNGVKIRIVEQPQNMGCWAARNKVLDEAIGKYILLIDSDDYFAEGAITKLYRRAEETNADPILSISHLLK